MKPLPLLLAPLVVLFSCAPGPTPPPVRAPEVLKPALGRSPAGPVAPNPGQAPAAPGPAVPVAPVRAFDESLLRGREFLLETHPGVPALVQDRDIGPLTDDPSLAAAVEALFAGAGAGHLDPGSVDPRWEAYLQAWAQRMKAAGFVPARVRVGPAVPGAGASVTVRVKAEAGDQVWTGWAVFEGAPGSGEEKKWAAWKASDVQVSPAARSAEPFDPEGTARGPIRY